MEKYEPSQGLLWVYDTNGNGGKGALYIQSTYYVNVGPSQSIASNPGDLIAGEAILELNVRGEVDPTSPPRLFSGSVWIRTDINTGVDNTLPKEEVKDGVKSFLESNGVVNKVTAIVRHADGSQGGEAVNLISQDDIVEVL
jgi:hypothetical protein